MRTLYNQQTQRNLHWIRFNFPVLAEWIPVNPIRVEMFVYIVVR